MSVRAQCLAVSERVGQRREQLLAIGAHEFGGDGGRGDFHQNDVIEANAVEGVFQRDHALDLVGHDHRVEHCANGQRCFAVGQTFLRQVICHRKNGPEVIRRMPPFGGEPGVVVIKPAHDAADIPCGLDRVEPKVGTGHPSTERDDGAFDNWPQMFGALGKTQGQQAAAQRVHQTVAGGIEGFPGFDFEVQDVIGNVLQDLVVIGAVVQVDVGTHVRFTRLVVR